jgi:hypothetical protein
VHHLAQVALAVGRERRAHAQVLDEDAAAGLQRPRHPRAEPLPIRDVHDGEQAEHRVERRVRQRLRERVAADMRDAIREPRAAREVDGEIVQLRLQLERGDVAANRVREKARRATNS